MLTANLSLKVLYNLYMEFPVKPLLPIRPVTAKTTPTQVGRKRTQSNEHGARISASRTGKPHPMPEGFGEKMRKVLTGLPKPEGYGERARQRILAKNGTGDYLDPRQSIPYWTWREGVLTRDNHTCQHCGITKAELILRPKKNKYDLSNTLQAHHPLNWNDYPELRFVVSNGLALCFTCHGEEHRRLKKETKCCISS